MNIFSKFIKKINAIPKIYNNFGLDGLLFSTLRNIGFDIKYQSIIDKRKESIEKKIMIKTNKTIIDGPYKNTQFSCKTNWGGYDWSSKLLGYYENQVQNKIIDIKNKYDLKNIINFGGSDGYHVIGLLKNSHFEKGLIFEKDNKNIEYLYENIQLNNIKSNIFLEKEANFKKIKEYFDDDEMSKTLYLIDIEGEEYNIINKNNLEHYKKSILIIEDHNFLIDDEKKKLDFLENLKQNFNVEILKNSSRNPFKHTIIDDFNDDDRWLIMSEGREKNMNWLVCVPK